MTKVIVKYDKSKDFKCCSFIELSGHSGYDEFGKDIVCSAITTASFTSINLLEKINKDFFKYRVDEKNGFLHIDLDYQKLSKDKIDLVNLVIDNLIDMYAQISSDYPKNLKIEIL